MAGKPRSNVLPEIRGGLKRFFQIQHEKGKPLSTIWAELFDKDPIQAMKLAIQAQPKEIDTTIQTSLEDYVTQVTQQQQAKPENTVQINSDPDTSIH